MQHNVLRVSSYLSIVLSFVLLLTTVLSTFSAFAAPNILWGCAINESQPQNDNSFGCPQKSQVVTGPWVMDGWKSYHAGWLSKFNLPQNQSKIPFIYGYVIAGKARNDLGLQDCNVNYWWSLCYKGADYVRSRRGSIVQAYRQMAYGIRQQMPNRRVMIQMEPDFYQYASGKDQQGGALSFAESQSIMNEITDMVKSILPNSKLVLDISPWNSNLYNWSRGFRNFSYSGIVGKWFDSYSAVDGKSYRDMISQSGYPLIVNTSHGIGGKLNWYNRSWEYNQSGVAGVIQSSEAKWEYESFLNRW